MSVRTWILVGLCLIGSTTLAHAQDWSCIRFSQTLISTRNDTCGDTTPWETGLTDQQTWRLDVSLSCNNGGWTQPDLGYVDVTATGTGSCGLPPYRPCKASFGTPTWSVINGTVPWSLTVQNRVAGFDSGLGVPTCDETTQSTYQSSLMGEACNGTSCCAAGSYCDSVGEWNAMSCACVISPIVIDLGGVGIELTDARHGVRFDLLPGGVKEQLAWTRPRTRTGFLALDRNGNGMIDDGGELFGSATDQPNTGNPRNGFSALAVFDDNRDGKITPADAIYDSLVLWVDANHNGRSDAGELISLKAAGIAALYLDYHMSRHTDQYGNRFRYRAKVDMVGRGESPRWAWDVFLVSIDPDSTDSTAADDLHR